MSQNSKPNIERLKYQNLESKQSFKKWIKDSMNSFYLDKDVPNSHLEIFINSIAKQVQDTKDGSIDRAKWLSRIRKIENTLKVLEEYNEEAKSSSPS
jgi:hypothetical protein